MSIPIESIKQGLALLPERFTSKAVFRMLVAIGLQESRFTHRYQVVQGSLEPRGQPEDSGNLNLVLKLLVVVYGELFCTKLLAVILRMFARLWVYLLMLAPSGNR